MSAAGVRCIALSGGVGGAKLADGLARAWPQEALLIVANTGDDFRHLGLHISPDVDTVMYTLSGLADPERGWGRAGETWSFMESMAELGAPTWFRLGDRDLALHVWRTERLRAGEPLSAITLDLARRLGVGALVTPMTDGSLATLLETDEGLLGFQEYFVHRQCAPRVRRVLYEAAAAAAPAPLLAAAMCAQDADVIVICPSNPYLSVDPILAVPGVREWLRASSTPVVAVSPIVAGEALKGPAARLLRDLAGESSVVQVARHYRDIADVLVLDERDSARRSEVEDLGLDVLVADTVMRSREDRDRLAGTIRSAVEARRGRR